MIEINSSTLISTETPFKIFAGPGAGKTYWLINHIENVLHNSKRLTTTTKIASITYTNIAVEEIQSRLGDSDDRVYVSTIHNFLYKFIVKPYGFLLKDNSGANLINLRNLDGHDEHIPNSRFVYDWKTQNKLNYIKDDKKIYECLQDLDWHLNADSSIDLGPRHTWKRKIGRYWIKKELFVDYKKRYWRIGTIHHEDVLYFAYKIISENPEVLEYVNLMFPYMFIDEFQDTNPIQTEIVKLISKNNTIVGVIGDAEQSIYKFQGATRQDFVDFKISGINNYQIKGNRRSTNKIINVLDNIRYDRVKQTPIRNIEGNMPTIYVGDKMKVIEYLTKSYPEISILTRNNETVGQIKNDNNKNIGNLWDSSRGLDSNYERQKLLYNSIYAAELCLLGYYKDAVRLTSKIFYKYKDGTKIQKVKKRELAIVLIDLLVSQKQNNSSKTLFDFYNSLFEYFLTNYQIKIGSKITRGKYKEFSENNIYADLVQALRIKDDTSRIKTIHKAKGAEYENVLVVMENSIELQYVLNPEKHQNEDDSRIYYVAFSRAKDNLFITVPKEFTKTDKEKFEMIGFHIKNEL
ncbi:UvrD-helicase domain-containing protein [Desulfobacula toluolica]|uniref:DNA 3'-5' helicase n=1 Tax=Desulfobacula toluolica (strain DSM 7467 / Tol2) TaxID=651182 RepID=K0NIH1_DESTT|nr:ATP-dependent helicase [Desulfobacula toluolica]CCK80745.1 ATP-dependent DNA helicase, UvrD family [Desulfobacula toluolica Tol2]